ncbi:uncharacterized protein LOC108920476 [Arapaima gigas]
METQESSVAGGVFILHKFVHGQHHYQVEKVMKHKMCCGHTSFVRKGDKLLQINGISLHSLPPEVFTQLLTESSPVLTVHQPHINTPEEKYPKLGEIHPFSKEHTFMRFSLEMKRGDTLENEGGTDSGVLEDEGPHDGSQSCLLDSLLMVAMRSTRFSIIVGRGCDKGKVCQDQSCTDCHMNVVIDAKSSKISQVLREINFLQEKTLENIFIQSLMYDKYIRRRSRRAQMSSNSMSNSAKITIYYYKSDCVDGEFSFSILHKHTYYITKSTIYISLPITLTNCEKCKLKNISTKNKDIFAFVFYMKASQPDTRHFESANCAGWYLHAKEEEVGVEPLIKEDESFFFLIEKG